MTPPKLDEAAIFNAARRFETPQEQRLFIDQTCAADDAMRNRLEALLRIHDEDQDFLEQPAPGVPLLVTSANERVGERTGGRIGAYALLAELGEGGFGKVFLAEQRQPVRRHVALKVIKPGMDTRQVVARFEAERQALALMDHPNIAHVFDGGTTKSGRPYFVMELVRGLPITKFCDDKRLALPERLALFHSVCLAVQHAHHKGIIHRDIKPSNVMVSSHDDTPVVKVIDFGIAKAIGQKLTDKTVYTQFAQFVGTPAYLSPEQANLSVIDVDTRTDIYALGVLLYELLTGSTPFAQERLHQAPFDELQRIIREEEPPRPSTRISSVGPSGTTISANRQSDPKRLRQVYHRELDWIVMKALEKDRTRRYETASAFAADVQRYLDHEPVQAYPPSVSYQLRKFVRRHQATVLSASFVGLALLAGIVGTTWGLIQATKAEALAVKEAKQKEAALTAARESQQEATDKLWLSLYERARAGRFSRQIGQRLDSLAALEQAARIRPDERLRDEAIAALALPDLHPNPHKYVFPSGTNALAFGNQGQLYARATTSGVISIHGISDDREIRSIAWNPITQRYLHFSSDDRYLLGLTVNYIVGLWRVADGQPVLRDKLRDCRSHAFSPDGKRLAIGQKEWVLLFDLSTGQEVKRFRLPDSAHSLAFHPDADKLAVGFFSAKSVCIFDATRGTLLAELPVENMDHQIVAWHPDGERLAVAGSDPRIQIWSVTTKRTLATLEGHVQQVTDLAFHPNGNLLASHSWEGRLLLWQPSTGRQLLGLTTIGAPQFSADGRWLRLTWDGNRSDLLEVASHLEYRTLVSSAGVNRGGYGLGDISPDGRLLAVGLDDGARVWNLDNGRELVRLPVDTPYVFFDTRRNADNQKGAISPLSLPWTLLSSGPAGLLRWPLLTDGFEGTSLSLEPPKQLSTLPRARFARMSDGRTLVAATKKEGDASQLLDLETGKVLQFGAHPAGEIRALSGDGRFAASSGWHSDRVRLWDVGTGRLIREWVLGTRTLVFFTPDSRALIICRGDDFAFWDLETLQPLRRISRDGNQFPGWVAFSPDARLVALEIAPGVIHLMEMTSGRTVARLTDPDGDRASWQAFAPDGTRLVVVAGHASAVHIWDLRAIRTRLKMMNLDWDWQEFPPGSARTRNRGFDERPKVVHANPGTVENDARRRPSDPGEPLNWSR
jgi:serine/threonine protein kinase/WD40 repeat protein